jgi:3-aminobutyryl-CoA ammonia-lyase
VPFGDAHYRGDLLSGGYVLSLFSDVATDLCLHLDDDEGLFAAYSEVTFHNPLRAGDVLEVQARVARVGRRSRTIEFEARVLAHSDPGRNETAGRVLDRPLIVVSATGTVVVPERVPAGGSGGQ